MAKDKPFLTRRDFLKGTAGATLAASLLGVPWSPAQAKELPPSLVTIGRDPKALDGSGDVNMDVLRSMLDEVLKKQTGQPSAKEAWLSLVGPDDVIGLVPTDHLNPTHSEVVDAVEESLKAAGIPSGNIKDATGGISNPKGCTALIALPGLKAHWLTGIGTVMKNYIMYSGYPSRYHHANSAKLGEIWNLPGVKGKTRLVLVDALYPLCDKGPQPDPRYQWPYNGLIAGSDPVAVERICLRIINRKRKEIRGEPWPLSPPPLCVEAADKVYGLGNSNMDKINLQHFGWKDGLLV